MLKLGINQLCKSLPDVGHNMDDQSTPYAWLSNLGDDEIPSYIIMRQQKCRGQQGYTYVHMYVYLARAEVGSL